MVGRKQILITTDSVCDLPNHFVKSYDIVIHPYYVNTEEGHFIDGVEIDTAGLMEYLHNSDYHASSESPSAEEYEIFFKEQLKKADNVIHITMAKHASEGYQNALEASKKYNGIIVFDSGHLSSGMGLLVLKAAKLAQEGCSVKQIVEALERIKMLVSTTFVIKETDSLYRSGRLSARIKKISDRLLLHPSLELKRESIVSGKVYLGRWQHVISNYIKHALFKYWEIDTDTLFITHVNLNEETRQFILSEIEKYCHFKNIYFQEASPAIACNCGEESFGLLFLKKEKEQKEDAESEQKSFSLWCNKKIEVFKKIFLNEDFEIYQRIFNTIMLATLVGGVIALFVTILTSAYESALTTLAVLVVLCIAIYYSVVKKNTQIAGIIICVLANLILFPIMFFTSGGVQSGMVVWFLLGLIFDWLILRGWICYVLYAITFIEMSACIIIGNKYPHLVSEMPENYMVPDILQALFLVSLIFGVIFKYERYIYEKQQKELLEHEKELLAANKAKSLFLANMSHEIRTPINGIIGMDNMLLRECGDNEALMEYGKNIQSASQLLLSIVNDILDISKIESDKLELIPVEYELFSVLNDCYNMTLTRANDKGLEFEIHVNQSLPCGLIGDEVRVRQIINNLLSNAVKYTEEGTISLYVDYNSRSDALIELSITVKDTGIGIKPEDINKLFDSFTRVDEKKNRNIEGTGLGLNLTRNLVEMMNGEITVNSIYGQGSTFTAKFMQQIYNRQPMGDFEERYNVKMEQNYKDNLYVYAPEANVLVVDDVHMNLLVMKGLLKYSKIQVDTAANGLDALSLIAKKKYDLIFLDHLMPKMDGVECFRRIKELDDNPNINTPIIILTANAIIGAKEEYLRVGFSDYLSKPVIEKELNNALEHYLPKEKVILKQLDDIKAENGIKTEHNTTTTDKGLTESTESTESENIIDEELGLQYCMNDSELYDEMLHIYTTEEKNELLKTAYASEDWKNYQVYIHALKSTSLNIGAKQLSEHAKMLEYACKENRIEYVKENHQAVMDEYQDVLQYIKNKLNE